MTHSQPKSSKLPMLVEVTDSSGNSECVVDKPKEINPCKNNDFLAQQLIEKKGSLTNNLYANYATEVGLYHEKNEDYAGFNNFFFGVADGVGGGVHGDIASQTVIKCCKNHERWKTESDIQTILTVAEAQVTASISERTDKRGGCAFAGVWLDSSTGQGYYSWVGDVRIYHIYPDSRAERQQDGLLLKGLTIDQTYENLKEQSPSGKQDNLARIVGFNTMGEPKVQELQLEHAEHLLIVCDGIHNFVSHQQLQAECQKLLLKDVNLEEICTNLISLAKNNNSHDDCTALIVSRVMENEDLLSIESKEPDSADSANNMLIQSSIESALNQKSVPEKLRDAKHQRASPLQIWSMAILFTILGIFIGKYALLDTILDYL